MGCKPLGAPRISFKTIATRILEEDLSSDLKSVAADDAGEPADVTAAVAAGDADTS